MSGIFHVCEHNSGGVYETDAEHWERLRAAGWKLVEYRWRDGRNEFVDVTEFGNNGGLRNFESPPGLADESAAIKAFEDVAKVDFYGERCDCCGQNYSMIKGTVRP